MQDEYDSIADRRAQLVVQCACELLGLADRPNVDTLKLPLSVSEFQQELGRRYGETHPELVFRSESTVERARLDRARLPELPRVVLPKGAPRRG